MATWTIGSGKGDSVAPGNYKDAIFKGVEEFESSKGDKLFRWKFEINGVQVNSISGTTAPTTKNKLGKFLCAISNQPPVEGTEIGDPNGFIGKKYFVVVTATEKGSQVEMFTHLG